MSFFDSYVADPASDTNASVYFTLVPPVAFVVGYIRNNGTHFVFSEKWNEFQYFLCSRPAVPEPYHYLPYLYIHCPYRFPTHLKAYTLYIDLHLSTHMVNKLKTNFSVSKRRTVYNKKRDNQNIAVDNLLYIVNIIELFCIPQYTCPFFQWVLVVLMFII